MIQSNFAFKIVNKIVQIKDRKNFFAVEKNSFYAEPLFFYVHDIYVEAQKISQTKEPAELGLYSFTTNAQLMHTPVKKVIIHPNSLNYQIYGIRSETTFYISEISKKISNSIEKERYSGQDIGTSPGAANIANEMDQILTQCFPTIL